MRLEGPHPLAEAARAVAAAVAELSDVFGTPRRTTKAEKPKGTTIGTLHRLLVAHIDAFSDAATAHLNAIKVRP
ncbi:hypothetical protein QC334_34245 [Streptomyces sp. DH18]|uniref:hypothetical protein n=1 Tax=Streptomyces sp. DH18 TaxID=3040126 RepID=UPI0024412C38|nr:hypothetical protein [Streptomyces sp. DH18]MDG9687731.1 hypothetical protein [Streptomyces sp. DH18]